jgi:hypothetical protein
MGKPLYEILQVPNYFFEPFTISPSPRRTGYERTGEEYWGVNIDIRLNIVGEY